MTPTELKSNRQLLGLSVQQLAFVLGYTGPNGRSSIYKMENGEKAITAPVERLVLAYRAGYRPDDWPR